MQRSHYPLDNGEKDGALWIEVVYKESVHVRLPEAVAMVLTRTTEQ